MKRKSIHDIAINATTLAGMQASFYDLNSIGLKTAINLTSSDANKVLDGGVYATGMGSISENYPYKDSNTFAILVVFVRSSDNRVQFLFTLKRNEDPRMFFRNQTGGNWSSWKEVATI